MKTYLIMLVLLLAIPAWGQADCDLNDDGNYFSIADVIFLLNELNSPEINFDICNNDCDPDDDGLPLTVADMILLVNTLIDPNYPDSIPDFTRNPDADTLSLASILTSPGAQLSLPLYLNTIDTLTAFQFYISVDPEYLEITDFEIDLEINLNFALGLDNIHVYTFNASGPSESILLLPGYYHIGDLQLNVADDIEEQMTTYAVFTGCPDYNFYTGFANLAFFEPVLVNSEINIDPTGIDHDESGQLPAEISITAYPNPFNSDIIIRVNCPNDDELMIYDILGREITSFQVVPGINNIRWNAANDSDKDIDSGIYFTKLKRLFGLAAKKLVFLK